MADTKISALTSAGALVGPEILAGVQSAASVGITATQIKTWTSASPTLVTPALGTPSAGVLTNCTGTASGLTAGNATLAATVTTNANLTGVITSSGNATSIASQTGTGTKFVVDTSPTLVTPVIGVATATSVNKVAITAPATSATLTIADGKTLTMNASVTLTGTDSTTMTFPSSSISVAGINLAQAWTKQQTVTLATLTDAANIDWDVSASAQKAKVTLGGSRTMNAVTNAIEGTTYLLWVIQDGTGSRTLTWTSSGAGSYDFGTSGAPTLTTTASKADLLVFEAISIGGTLKLRYCGVKQGFA